MKDIIGIIETSKKSYPICFNLNVMEELQDKYGSINKWGEIVENKDGGEPKIKELKEALTLMINEAIDIQNDEKDEKENFVNSKQVGRIISEIGFKKTTEIIMNLTKESVSIDDDLKNE